MQHLPADEGKCELIFNRHLPLANDRRGLARPFGDERLWPSGECLVQPPRQDLVEPTGQCPSRESQEIADRPQPHERQPFQDGRGQPQQPDGEIRQRRRLIPHGNDGDGHRASERPCGRRGAGQGELRLISSPRPVVANTARMNWSSPSQRWVQPVTSKSSDSGGPDGHADQGREPLTFERQSDKGLAIRHGIGGQEDGQPEMAPGFGQRLTREAAPLGPRATHRDQKG